MHGTQRSIPTQVRAKLELLASQSDCPVCFEPLAGVGAGATDGRKATTLGCAHRVCEECWAMWSASCRARGKAPFCPLCREDEFVGYVM